MNSTKLSEKVTYVSSILLILTLAMAACQPPPVPTVVNTPTSYVIPSSTPASEEESNGPGNGTVDVVFHVSLPEPLAAGDIIYLVVVDELTGLSYNQHRLQMTAENDRSLTYTLNVPSASVIRYRYFRQRGQGYFFERLINSEVRFRAVWAGVNIEVSDRVFCWEAGLCVGAVGRIAGIISDEKGMPVPGVRVFSGGAQAISAADGSYLLEDVPAGEQNLVAIAGDGGAFVFQQGALVNPDSLTPANISLQSLPMVEVVFLVSVPLETPQNAVVRIAGNLSQLGEVFTDLDGALNISSASMPAMARLEDGRYFYRMWLPAGAEIIYRYTLGDGLWNSEHAADGSFLERRLSVPDYNLVLEDTVTSWRYGSLASLDLFVTVPAITPANELVSIQLDPGLGWMEPLAMWPAGENRWHLTLYSPLVGIGQIKYRYCRNLQCDSSSEISEAPRYLIPDQNPQVKEDTVLGWHWWQGIGEPAVVPSINVQQRQAEFVAGFGWTAQGYRHTWARGFSAAAAETAALNGEWLLLQPTWSVSSNGSPRFAYNPATDFDDVPLRQAIQEAQTRGLRLALFPGVNFPGTSTEWWLNAPRSFPWWQSLFESYRRYLLSIATLAEQQGGEMLVLGGDWLSPMFTYALLPDGTYAGAPADANERWKLLIEEIRTRYHGQVYWAMAYDGNPIAPPVLNDQVDGLLVTWSVGLSPVPSYDANRMAEVAGLLMDEHISKLSDEAGKPVILGFSYPSAHGSSSGCVDLGDGQCATQEQLSPEVENITQAALDLQEQLAIYNALFTAVEGREWIDGVLILDFYPAGPVQDRSASVYAKPASGVVWYWFGKILGK